MSEVFLKIVNMSISASWLVLAVLLLRLILKAAPKWVSVLLWGFVAVRLICPISIESALSLIPSAEPIPEQAISNLVVDVPAEIPGFDAPIQDQTESPVRDETADQHVADVTEPEKRGIPAVTVLTALWAAGVGAMLAYTAVSYFLLRRKVATAVRFRDNIYQSENVDSPFVLGVVKPRIYLPFRMDGRDLAHVIAHEEAHIRRKDHWWKPFGFVLLALHWFNPLIWAGYILLCRDIELACDEKVIKEMDNQTKADYTEALVACSVNRRRIAACPLAFGEVGVKERVKTVMNYKKPAFWIVIVAVALCIVVAVCFLTDPKAPVLEVDDPTMLEFPGLKWGMTVEEVKQAINITEEQISTDKQLDSDQHLLHVKDITFFGEKVSIGAFKFLPVDEENFGLSYVMLFLDEDTDMDKLQTTLSDSYNNQGTGEYFMGYSLSTGSGIHSNVDPDELEYKLYEYKRCLDWKVDDNGNFQSSSIFAQEQAKIIFKKINEPGLKTYNWVSPVKAAEAIDPEDLDTIKEAYERYLDIDPSLTDEWLEKSPLVHMSIANRSEQAIRAELEGVTEGELTLATNNIVVLDAQMLFKLQYDILQAQQALNNPTDDTTTASDPTEAPTLATDPPVTPATQSEILASILDVDEVSMLCFPGLKWGDSVETVKTVLGVTEEQIKMDEPYGDAYGLWVENISFFGGDVANGQFTFLGKNGEYYLESITLYYVDGTDMTAVEDALLDHYGAPKDGEGFTVYTVSNGAVKSSTKVGFSIDFNNDEPHVMRWWESAAKRTDLLPADVQEAMIETGHVTYYTERLNPADPTTRPLIQEYLNSDPAVLLYCTNGEKLGQIPYTKNVVSFNAHLYVYQLLYCRK